MYTTLLGSALDQSDQSDHTATIGDLFATLLRSKAHLRASGISSPKQAKTLGDVTGQLAYDISLINLVRRLGLGFAIDRFDNGERHLLEQGLVDRGLPLDWLDDRS
jgi:hypothetical protein